MVSLETLIAYQLQDFLALTVLRRHARAAIGTQQVCGSVGGQWHSAACKVGAEPLCASAGGTWAPRRMWSLEGGMDLLIVGLLQGCGGYPFFDPCAPLVICLVAHRKQVRSSVYWSVDLLQGLVRSIFQTMGLLQMPFSCLTACLSPPHAWRSCLQCRGMSMSCWAAKWHAHGHRT